MTVVENLEGRMDDYLYTGERGFIGRIDPVFKGVQHVVESQIVQESLDLIRVLYVPTSSFTTVDLSRLESNLRARIGQQVGLEFVRTDTIPRSRAGKFRAVVSKLPAYGRLENELSRKAST
jgi:phenylacetate-CoA ligase